MIAKAESISHGANAIRYSVDKDRADIVKTNHLPNDISPDASLQAVHAENPTWFTYERICNTNRIFPFC